MKWSLETVCNRGVTWVGQILKKWSFIWYNYLGPASNKGPLPCAASYSGESRNCKGRTWSNFYFFIAGIAKEEPGVCKSLTSIPVLVCEVRQKVILHLDRDKPNQTKSASKHNTTTRHALHLAQVARRRVWDTAAARNKESQSWLSKRFLERRFFSFLTWEEVVPATE